MRCRPPPLRTSPLLVSVFHCSYHSRGGNFGKSEKYFSDQFLSISRLSTLVTSSFLFFTVRFANYHLHSQFRFPQPRLRHFEYDAVCITVGFISFHSQGPQIVTNILQVVVFNVYSHGRSKYYLEISAASQHWKSYLPVSPAATTSFLLPGNRSRTHSPVSVKQSTMDFSRWAMLSHLKTVV